MTNKPLSDGKKRDIAFDVLRVCAAFAVVIMHVIADGYYDLDIDSTAWQLHNFWNSAVRWAVPIFVMISGALLLDPEKPLDIRMLFQRRILRIVTAFFFWSVIYMLYCRATLGEPHGLLAMLLRVVKGHYHMWYLYMILGLYLIVPLVRKITADRKAMQYFLLLSLVFSFLLHSLETYAACFLPLIHIGALQYLVDGLLSAAESFHFHFTLSYVAYFVLGYYLHTAQLSVRQRRWIYLLGFAGFAFTVLSSHILSLVQGTQIGLNESMDFNVLLLTAAVFVFAKQCAASGKLQKAAPVLHFIAPNCFGIYLIHALLRAVLADFFLLTTWSFSPWLSIPLLSALIFVLSLLITIGIRRIPVINKYIV